MTFYIGQKKAGEIFLGGKKIGRIYLGQTLVHMTAVVSKPTFLEYIETDGNSYIDTGYLPSENTYVEYTFEIISKPASTFNGLFGSRLNTSRYPYNVFCKNNLQLRIDYGRYDESQHQCAFNTKYTIRAGNNKVYINDELVKSYVVDYPGTSPYSMYLGNFNNNGTPYATGTAQKIYGWKAYENNVLSQDLRPALDPSGKVCMYDTISGKYFYNAGTGELKAGGRFVESIVFDGASYIDTGIAQQTCTVECGIKFANADTRQLMGFHSSNGGYWGCRNISGRYEASGGLLNTTVSALDYNDVVIDYNCDDVTAPSVRVTVKDATASVVGTNIFATKNYTIGALITSSDVALYHITGQVYYNKFYIGGELVQDLRPYVDSNGVVCFKDVVTDTLFYNQGTGTLTYTE